VQDVASADGLERKDRDELCNGCDDIVVRLTLGQLELLGREINTEMERFTKCERCEK